MSLLTIGVSGWHYKEFYGLFYPRRLPSSKLLSFYSEHFDGVEVNNSFYRTPTPSVLYNWYNQTPENFVFAVKANRYLTHIMRLNHPAGPVREFVSGLSVLGKKLGPVLFQLPPNWKYDEKRLKGFLTTLPKGASFVLELRDRSWIHDDALALLAKHDVAFCIYDLAGYQSPLAVTSRNVYVRLHGPDAAYCGNYSPTALREWAERIRVWHGEGRTVSVFFDNTAQGHAAQNALDLKALCEEFAPALKRAAPPPLALSS